MIPLFNGLSGPEQYMEIDCDREEIPVSSFVDKRLFKKLVTEFGILENAAAKALYLTGNDNVWKALAWLERNKSNIDFNKSMNAPTVNQFMKRSTQPNECKQQDKETPINCEEFIEELKKTIVNQKLKFDCEGRLQLLIESSAFMESKEGLEDLLRQKESDEWCKIETKVLQEIEITNDSSKVECSWEVRKAEREMQPKKNKLDLFAQTTVGSSESEKDYAEMSDEIVEETNMDKINNCIDKISQLPDDKCINLLKKILNGLLHDEKQYERISKTDKEDLMVIKDAIKLLELIGYIDKEDRLEIAYANKDLINEIIEALED